MLENPANRQRSFMKQPMPGAADIHGANTKNLPMEAQQKVSDTRLEDVSEEDQKYLSAIDQRMVARRDGKIPPHATPAAPGGTHGRIEKLEKQVSEMQELMMEIIKTQMKLINEA